MHSAIGPHLSTNGLARRGPAQSAAAACVVAVPRGPMARRPVPKRINELLSPFPSFVVSSLKPDARSLGGSHWDFQGLAMSGLWNLNHNSSLTGVRVVGKWDAAVCEIQVDGFRARDLWSA